MSDPADNDFTRWLRGRIGATKLNEIERRSRKRDPSATLLASSLSSYLNRGVRPKAKAIRDLATYFGESPAAVAAMLPSAFEEAPAIAQAPATHDRELIRLTVMETIDQMNRRQRPLADPDDDPVLAQIVAELRADWERMTPDQVTETQRCLRAAVQANRREERVQASQ